MVQTENTGKIFEKAVCLLYNTPYIGKYKYDLETPHKLAERLVRLKTLFPDCIHSAKNGSRYDFTSTDGTEQHLSAKTTKKDGKVAPQVIGQAKPQKFCELTGLTFTDIPTLKRDIQGNIQKILAVLFGYTFDCPIVYYNQYRDTILFVKAPEHQPDWSEFEYSWTKLHESWNGSTTLKIGSVPVAEFQFHSKSRTNMAIRWNFEDVIKLLKLDFELL